MSLSPPEAGTWYAPPSGGGGGGVTSLIAGSGIAVSAPTGAVTVSATGGGDTVLLDDTFTRADESPLGAPYANGVNPMPANLDLIGGKVVNTTGATQYINWTTTVGHDDVLVEATFYHNAGTDQDQAAMSSSVHPISVSAGTGGGDVPVLNYYNGLTSSPLIVLGPVASNTTYQMPEPGPYKIGLQRLAGVITVFINDVAIYSYADIGYVYAMDTCQWGLMAGDYLTAFKVTQLA
jgi:hypothetical protein